MSTAIENSIFLVHDDHPSQGNEANLSPSARADLVLLDIKADFYFARLAVQRERFFDGFSFSNFQFLRCALALLYFPTCVTVCFYL